MTAKTVDKGTIHATRPAATPSAGNAAQPAGLRTPRPLRDREVLFLAPVETTEAIAGAVVLAGNKWAGWWLAPQAVGSGVRGRGWANGGVGQTTHASGRVE